MSMNAHFKVNARLMDVVGYELINDDNIAVAELVKNAIDAKARRVDIVFDGAEGNAFRGGGRGRIIIADDGEGMGRDDIENKWLNIAYSAKRAPAAGEFLAGNKGIGRFSCDRLGLRLRLLAQKEGEPPLSLEINWQEFDTDARIEQIPANLREGVAPVEFCKGLPEQVSRARRHGIVLEMAPLRSDWGRKKILVLRRLLEKMVNLHEDMLVNPGCRIYVHAPELRDGLTGMVKNRIFDKLDFDATGIESRIGGNGGSIETEIRDRGRMIARVVTENPYPALGDARISLYHMNPYKKAMFKRMTGVGTMEFGSVFLFLNGFRVPPYGDRGDDWLSLDNRKTQGTMRHLGARDILGRIEVRDQGGEKFRVVSSREGIVHNDAYRELVDVDRSEKSASYGGYFYDVLGRLEAYVVDGLAWDSLPVRLGERQVEQWLDEGRGEVYKIGPDEKDRRILGVLHKIVAPPKKGKVISVEIDPQLLRKLREEEQENAARILARWGRFKVALSDGQAREFDKIWQEHNERQERQIKSISEGRNAAEERAEKAEERAEKAEERAEKAEEVAKAAIENSKRMFAARGLNPEMDGVWETIHQMGIKIRTLNFNMRRISAEEMGGGMKDSIRERFHKMRRAIGEIDALRRYLVNRSFADAYTTLTGDIPQFLRGYAGEWEKSGRVRGFRFSCAPGLSFVAKFSPMDLTIILDNLVDNARKAARRSGRKPGIRLNASASADKGELVLQFADDAGGLEKLVKDANAVFDAGFSTTGGMGLGLSIVRDIVEKKMHGKIRCVPARGGLEFEIKFPKR